jgi:ribose transport system substrate-binding protein
MKLSPIRRSSTGAVLAALVIVATGATAIGQSAAPDGSAAVSPDAELVAQAKAELEKATAWPSEWTGPTTPTTPQAGKKVVVISCSQATACAQEVEGIVEAGQVMGWDVQVVDGKGDPAVYDASIRNAVTSGADGIILASINVGLVVDALRFAKDQGVPVLNNASITDANAGLNPADGLVAGNNPDPNPWEGRMVANWLIADSDGTAKVVLFRTIDAGIVTRDDAVVARLKECTGCQILDEIWIGFETTTTPKMATQISSVLDRFGEDVQYIMTPYSAADAFAVPELQRRDRPDVKIVGFPGTEQQVKYCAEGQNVAAVMGTDLHWGGWAAVDLMNRILAGEPVADENNQWMLQTQETCPASGNFAENNTMDYRSQYKQLWGIE